MTTKTPFSKNRSLRWWHLLCYLAVSLLLWWGVDKLVEPQPVWSIDSSAGKGVEPLFEQENGPYLLAAEVLYKTGMYNRVPVALMVIDKLTGNVLHRLETGDPSLLKYNQINIIPRIHGDVIWRLSITENVNGSEYRLCAWRFTEENTERTMHVWQDSLIQQMRFLWPGKSKVILIHQQQKPLESKVWNQLINYLFSLSLVMECNVLFPEIPPLFETWQLPETPDKKPQKLCQWSVPANRIDAAWDLSEDGKRLVVMEPPGNSGLARQRALASGKDKFHGRELYDLYRSDARGMQVYDTSTGRYLHHYQDEYVPYLTWGWRGSYLIAGVVNSNHITEELTLTDLLRRDIEWIPCRLDLLKPFQRNVYRINEHGVQPVKMTTAFRDTGVQFAFFGSILQGFLLTWKTGIYSHLRIDEDQLKQMHIIEYPGSRYQPFCPWLPVSSGQQYITISSKSWLSYFSTWKYKWGWFQKFFEKLEEQPWIEHSIITVHEGAKQQPFSHAKTASPPEFFSMLYLHRIRMEDVKTVLGSTLHAYELPMQIHSPWWARTAAMLPWLWLVMLLLRRHGKKKV